MEGWLVGELLILVGCMCSAIGLILMKHSTNVESELPFMKRPFWWTGFLFLMTNALVIDVIAFSSPGSGPGACVLVLEGLWLRSVL